MASVTSTEQPTTVTIGEKYLLGEGAFPTVNLGPLTTAFQPPNDCDVLTVAYNGLGGHDVVYGSTCALGDHRLSLASSCVPPRYASAYDLIDFRGDDLVLPFFSPGLTCPYGYEPKCTYYGNSTVASGQWLNPDAEATVAGTYLAMLDAQETAIGCCPRNYLCNLLYGCASIPTISATVVANDNDVCLDSVATERTYTAKRTARITAYAAMVVLVQSETTSTATSTSTVAETTSTSLSDANATPNSTPEPKGSGGLSAGTKAGIAVGTVLGVIFLAVAAFLLFRRRRRKQAHGKAEESKTETDRSHGIFDWMRRNEAAAAAAAEQGPTGATLPSELDATTDPRHSRGVSTVMSETTAWSDGKRMSELHGTSNLATPNLHDSITELPVEMDGSNRGQRDEEVSEGPGNGERRVARGPNDRY